MDLVLEWCMGKKGESLFVVNRVVFTQLSGPMLELPITHLECTRSQKMYQKSRVHFQLQFVVALRCRKTLVNLLSTCQSHGCLPIYPHWANWQPQCARGGEITYKRTQISPEGAAGADMSLYLYALGLRDTLSFSVWCSETRSEMAVLNQFSTTRLEEKCGQCTKF